MKTKVLMILAFILSLSSISSVHATDFENNEYYYTDLCKNTERLSTDDIQTCEEFMNYLKGKNAKIEQQISQTENQLASTLASIEQTEKKLQETESMISSVQNELSVLEAAIIQTTSEIRKKEMRLADRMYFIQSYVNGNEYLYLLLKSNSLDQLLTRIQNIDELTQYDKDLIVSLSKAKAQLEIDQAEANQRYNDLFALQTQQMTLLLNLGQKATSYSTSLEELRDTIAGNRVDIGFIDNSLTEAEKRIQAEEERKKAEEEAKRQEEEEKKKQEEENKKQEENDNSSTNNDSSNNDGDNSSNNNNDSSSNPDNSSNNSSSTSPPVPTGIVATAKSKVGCRYVYGGTGPDVFDCSGFAQWVYRQNNIYIPRTVTSQYYACELVDQPQPGDLLFFNTTGYLGHVGIYIGGDLFIHAGTSSTGVCYGNLTYAYWQNCYQGAGRFK